MHLKTILSTISACLSITISAQVGATSTQTDDAIFTQGGCDTSSEANVLEIPAENGTTDPDASGCSTLAKPKVSVVYYGTTVVVSWNKVSKAQNYGLQYRDGNGSWKSIPGATSSTSKSFDDLLLKSPRTYRVNACNLTRICSGWSTPSNSVPLARNIRDNNGNSMRDDVDSVIKEIYPTSGDKQAALSHFAHFSNKFRQASLGDESQLLQAMNQMQRAYSCLESDPSVLQHFRRIQAMQLDTTSAYRRYLASENAYSKSDFARYSFNKSCGIRAASAKSNFLSSIEAAELQGVDLLADNLDFTDATTGLSNTQSSNSEGSRYIHYINGMFNDFLEASTNMKKLQDLLRNAGHSNFIVNMTHNRPESAVLDIRGVVSQSLMQEGLDSSTSNRKAHELVTNGFLGSNKIQKLVTKYIVDRNLINKSDPDDQKHVTDNTLEMFRRSPGIVIVPHSQGNFFANKTFDEISTLTHDIESKLRVVGVGSPASKVPLNGPYFNNALDKVLEAIRKGSPVKPLPANFTYKGKDFLNHSFIDTYLSPAIAPRIITAIAKQHKEMDDMRKSVGVCTPQTISGAYKSHVTVSLLPGKDFKGNITLTFNAFNSLATNKFEVRDISSRILYTTGGFVDGIVAHRFYYDYSINDILNISIGTPNPNIDEWEIKLDC